jgi:hypothetical protein
MASAKTSVPWVALLIAVWVMPVCPPCYGLLRHCLVQPVCHAPDKTDMRRKAPQFVRVSDMGGATLPPRPQAGHSKFLEKIPNFENRHGTPEGPRRKGGGKSSDSPRKDLLARAALA